VPDRTKIATCSYCGTRAVLELGGRKQHELVCSACGAQLHDMKPVPRERLSHDTKPSPRRPPPHRAEPWRPPRPKKRKSGGFGRRFRKLVEEVFDELEDIFD